MGSSMAPIVRIRYRGRGLSVLLAFSKPLENHVSKPMYNNIIISSMAGGDVEEREARSKF